MTLNLESVLGLLGAAALVDLIFVAAGIGVWRWSKRRTHSPVHAREIQQDHAADAPQPIDPANPPRYMKYNPKGGYDPARAVKCTCHQRAIKKGETVLLWPIPGHPEDGMDVLCEETYRKAQP